MNQLYTLGFYNPESKKAEYFETDSVSFPTPEVILFLDIEKNVWRVKNLKHLF